MRLKTVEKLIKYADIRKGSGTTLGNHWVSVGSLKLSATFGYHSTAIARVLFNHKTIEFDNGGWDTSSTNTALRDYFGEYVVKRGYKDVTDYTKHADIRRRLYR